MVGRLADRAETPWITRFRDDGTTVAKDPERTHRLGFLGERERAVRASGDERGPTPTLNTLPSGGKAASCNQFVVCSSSARSPWGSWRDVPASRIRRRRALRSRRASSV